MGSGSGSGLGPGAQSDCRSRYQLLLSGKALAERYRRIYTAAISDKDQGIQQGRNKKILGKKKLKRKQKSKSKVKARTKGDNLEGTFSVPDIKLHSNPSAFNVYCNVRQCVLEWQRKEASLALALKNSVLSGDSDSDEEEESKELPVKLPKIVGIGLCGVFELIKETRFSHPSLCHRSLQALLDMLQGQQPEGLQSEPTDVLESLFQLLLETTIRSTGLNDSMAQSLTALSCACLFSLVVAWGDTGKTLQAISAILTNNGSHACQTIQVPTILNSLQRSVQAVLVGKIQIQDWFNNGIKKASLMHKWALKEVTVDEDEHCLLQSDGSFLYLLCRNGLYRVGSGYSGTVRGHVYSFTSNIRNRKDKRSWLGFAKGFLLYRELVRIAGTFQAKFWSVDALDSLKSIITELTLCHQTEGQNILFTDGEYINQIAASKDDGFVVRIYATSTESVLQQELQLKLARKCLHACGISLFDLEKDLHIINSIASSFMGWLIELRTPGTGFDDDSAVLGAGREFALMKTAAGKIYYTGKYQSLGIKQGGPAAGKWVELPITKSPKIVQFSVGHDGSHALLVAEDGSVFFTGSSSKGEDGESTKSRRQAKPYKPKKMIKMEGKVALYTACNNGSSSVLTKDGELYMFGKDAIYCDSSNLVIELKGHFVTQVAMGKAHACVLTKNGEVWTFGVNNKGQCGRDTGSMNQGGKAPPKKKNSGTVSLRDIIYQLDLDEKDEKAMMCPPGMHKWKLDQCMVCTACGDCTGYGPSCVSSGRPDRVPGGICGCGSGESGCSVCGCCKACARELDGQEARQNLQCGPCPTRSQHRRASSVTSRRKEATNKQKTKFGGGGDGSGERGEKDASKTTTYPPGAVRFDCELRAVQVSCGFHHSVILMENGDVYTFGYGQHGQLGHGDVNSRGAPTLVQGLPGPSTQVTAGSNHTAVLLTDGQVSTFGSFSKKKLKQNPSPTTTSYLLKKKKKNQTDSAVKTPGPAVGLFVFLGGGPVTAVYPMPEKWEVQGVTLPSRSENKPHVLPILDMPYWNAKPAPMPNIGAKYGRKATWIGASGDQTFLRIDEALINSHVLATSEIFASKQIIVCVYINVSVREPSIHMIFDKSLHHHEGGPTNVHVLTHTKQPLRIFSNTENNNSAPKTRTPPHTHTQCIYIALIGTEAAGLTVACSVERRDLSARNLKIKQTKLKILGAPAVAATKRPGIPFGAHSHPKMRLNSSPGTSSDEKALALVDFSFSKDPVFDVLWRFMSDTREFWCYNSVVADARLPSVSDMQTRCSILSPELALPIGPKAFTTRSHGALHVLACIHILSSCSFSNRWWFSRPALSPPEHVARTMASGYAVLGLFRSHGGGWGYSAHSVEAIRFCADTDILLGGLGLFGGRGEYTAKIKLFELGPDGGDHETDGDLLAETDVLAYDCAAREKYAMMFDEPVILQSGWWYVAWARVSGPSSDCGSHGQASITTDDGVIFQFKSSKKSNNGTDVNAGQIPQLLYRLPSSDGNGSKGKQQTSEPVHILKKSFARTVSVECFESLLSILHWSWTTLVLGVEELRGLKGYQYIATLLDLERLKFVGTCCLRLLRVYTCEIYPISEYYMFSMCTTGHAHVFYNRNALPVKEVSTVLIYLCELVVPLNFFCAIAICFLINLRFTSVATKAVVEETSKLAECIGKTRSLLKGVDHCMVKLDNDPQGYHSQPLALLEAVLQECHNTFTACFHSFYPTPALQWACLCDLLNCLDQTSSSRLLAAVMSALCHTSVKLTSILPIAYDGEVLLRTLAKQASTENDSALAHRFPLLVAQMEKLSQKKENEENLTGITSFREVLEKMLVIVVLPVRKSLRQEMELFSPHLVSNTCGLLASIVCELTVLALGSEKYRKLLLTPSLHKSSPNRFTKTSQGRSWNTGNGSPDAICFMVDKPGVVVVGFCVYGGGGIHEYELEVLVDDSENTGDSSHSHRWTTLELVKGTYSTDDSSSDMAEIRLDKAVPLKENVKYAVRLRNYGSRTANGDGGMTTVQCPDGVTFTFSTCSLSSNGTNQTRGQIPQILYYRFVCFCGVKQADINLNRRKNYSFVLHVLHKRIIQYPSCVHNIDIETERQRDLKYSIVFFAIMTCNFFFWFCRSEYDGDLQSQLLSKANEEDKNCSRALSVVGAVARAAKDLLHRAVAVDASLASLLKYSDRQTDRSNLTLDVGLAQLPPSRVKRGNTSESFLSSCIIMSSVLGFPSRRGVDLNLGVVCICISLCLFKNKTKQKKKTTATFIICYTTVIEKKPTQVEIADDIPELLSSSSLFSMLLPLILAYIGPVAATIPKAAVEVFGLVQQLLPAVAALNQKYAPPAFNPNQSTDSATGNMPEQGLSACTTSNHYAVVESDHPYKPASVAQYKVSFPECVRWMTIEFDPQCGTGQPEDVLRLLIPSRAFQNSGFASKQTAVPDSLNSWIELKKFSCSSGWPTTVLVLPGKVHSFYKLTQNKTCTMQLCFDVLGADNLPHKESIPTPTPEQNKEAEPKMRVYSVAKIFKMSQSWRHSPFFFSGNEALFSLETASDYVKDEKACFFGFKCIAVGYEFSPGTDEFFSGIIQLEKELAYLGSVCAAALMKKDLALPIGSELEEDLEILEESALQVCKAHSGILGKGLVLSHSPTILEALEGNLPIHIHTNEHSFLEDFIACVPGSSGGRLARWLQPDSYADPQKTSLLLNKDDIRCSWPVTITVLTKDQYGDVVHVPNMKVEVKAIPVSQKKTSVQQENIKKLQRIPGSPAIASSSSDLTFGGLPSPKLEASYEPVIVKEARYIAVTMMKAYENYSFEELRFASPTPKRPSENMLIRANNDGSYSANWTPGAVGLYTVHVTIDGIEIDAGLEVEVKDPPKGMIPPGTQLVKPKVEPQPSKVRVFVAKDSAGLRIRSHPSLQSEQIGIVKVNGTITFIDEIHNDDGVWLRLNDETVKKYVPNMNGYTEAWCLSFNQHLGKSLLVPVDNREKKMYRKSATSLLRGQKNPPTASPPSLPGEKSPLSRPPPPPIFLFYRANTIGSRSSDSSSKPFLNPGLRWMLEDIECNIQNKSSKRQAPFVFGQPLSFQPPQPQLLTKPCYFVSTVHIGANFCIHWWVLVLGGGAARLRSLQEFFFGINMVNAPPRSRAESPAPGSRSSSPKQKALPGGKSSPSSVSSPRSLSPHDKSLPQKVVQENLHSEVVEVCTSSTLKANGSESIEENGDVKHAEDNSSKVHFSIGKAPSKEEQDTRASPKVSRKSTTRHVRPKKAVEPAKQAMSPSVAECARAVFAAFLWHEGIVHDAMACSSFLKFNPELSKEHAPIRSNLTSQQSADEKETKLKNRHSLEISSALNMFNISPHGPDISKMGSINKNKVLSMLKEPPLHEKCEDAKAESTSDDAPGPHQTTSKSKSPLPLTLQHLVAFWEDISLATIKAATQNMIFPSPGSSAVLKKKENEKDNRRYKKEKKKKDKSEVRPREMAQLAMGGPEKDTICELCGESHPYPVTYHMRQAHPGCGRYAGGQGYNSIGHFCGGWAGNCGDGGIGGSTWYLVCDRCREKYLREKQAAAREKSVRQRRQEKKKRGEPLNPRGKKNIDLWLRNEKYSAWIEKSSTSLINDVSSPVALLKLDFTDTSLYRDPTKVDVGFVAEIILHEMKHKGKGSEANNTKMSGEISSKICTCAQSGVSRSNSAAEPSILCYHPPKPFLSQLPSLREGISEDLPAKMTCLYLQTLARYCINNCSLGNTIEESSSSVEARWGGGGGISGVITKTLFNNFSVSGSIPLLKRKKEENNHPTYQLLQMHAPMSLRSLKHSALPARVKAVPRRRVNSGDAEILICYSDNSARQLTKDLIASEIMSLAEVGSSLLRHPSPELSRLISAHSSLCKGERNFQWPVLAFVIQHHDLEGLEVAMKHALRKSACRVFAMEAFNWLLCSVIQTTSLHDILWHFVASLTPSPVSQPLGGGEKDTRVCEHPLSDIVIAGEAAHPLPHTFHHLLQTISDLMMSLPGGSALQQMALRCWSLKFKQSDHQFLHQSNVFHHINNILSKSDDGDSEESFNISVQSGYEAMNQIQPSKCSRPNNELCMVTCLKDLTAIVDIKTSSRPAMIGSLTDGSTETFWESGDEDKNKTKSITVSCVKGINAHYISVHVDNSRDLGNKVTSMAFLTGKTVEELCRIKQMDLDSRHIGWVTCEVPGGESHVIKIELKGPENTLRVRQVKVLGWKDGESIKIAGQIAASVAQQKNCEAETLRVFRLITSQVFGKLMSNGLPIHALLLIDNAGAHPGPESLKAADRSIRAPSDADLKEHMVGIIFSRSKLTNLQKQVCTHIVQAIRMEATRVREEWEHAISSKENANSQPSDEDASSDAYCFELLSMVLALSGSNVGRQYLAQQLTLLQDLFSLLHTASPRVQRQVTSLLRRVLPEVTPACLASIIGVKALPPADISDIIHSTEKGDWNKLGILDMLLGCIAKALTVQLKAKGTTITGTAGTAAEGGSSNVMNGYVLKNKNKKKLYGLVVLCLVSSSLSNSSQILVSFPLNDSSGSLPPFLLSFLPPPPPNSYIRRGENHWWMKGSTPTQIAEIIIKLVKDMGAGHLSEAWSRVTKNAIAETIIALTKMEEEHRSPVRCIATTRLWLALASLCVLDQDHVDRLSSGRWMVLMCIPNPMCDNHDDGETAAIILCNVCGNLCTDCDRFLHLHRRTRTHQRQVFKEEEEAIKVDLHEGCGRTKLFWLMALADSKTMKAMVEFRENTGKPTSSSNEACRFCGSRSGTELSAVGSVCSDPDCQEYAKAACSKTHPCGHICGGVKNEEQCLPCLHGCDKSTSSLKQDADDMCMICFTEALSAAPAVQLDCSHVFHLQCCRRVLENRWIGPRITFGFLACPICKNTVNHPRLKDLLDPIRQLYEDVRKKALMRLEYEGLHKSVRFYNDPAGFAMNRYAYYVCYKCKKKYINRLNTKLGKHFHIRELYCRDCKDPCTASATQMCPKHGTDFLEYKCRYCCSVAVFFCFGTTHFCNACHDDFQRITSIPKEELPRCPAGPRGKQVEGTECPLHVVHPPTGEEFALGCGVCRNAHTF
uniref:RCR-type E3 ubiquitin transferase n=1 Tax=Latimeria chalumnae TaxID=7897 RepID=H3A1N3_LATCH